MTNPQPSFFSFKSIIENSKMQVGILNLCIYQLKKCPECSYKNTGLKHFKITCYEQISFCKL